MSAKLNPLYNKTYSNSRLLSSEARERSRPLNNFLYPLILLAERRISVNTCTITTDTVQCVPLAALFEIESNLITQSQATRELPRYFAIVIIR